VSATIDIEEQVNGRTEKSTKNEGAEEDIPGWQDRAGTMNGPDLDKDGSGRARRALEGKSEIKDKDKSKRLTSPFQLHADECPYY
jgi:hypothetical protein